MNVGNLVKTAMNAVPADLKAAVTFTKTTQTHTPATDTIVSATSSVSGYASQDEGSTETYRALGLVPERATTLIFVPNTLGETPALGSTCTWAGVTQTVKSSVPIAPGGTSFASRVIVVAA